MAHFAELDENNIVKQVIVVNNNELLENGIESEEKGINFCKSIYGENTKWVQASYNANFRGRYPGMGYVYNEEVDVFTDPQPYPSWTLGDDGFWIPPVERPPFEEGVVTYWNEELQQWEEM